MSTDLFRHERIVGKAPVAWIVILAIVAAGAFALGWLVSPQTFQHAHDTSVDQKYHCSMDPQIRQRGPGQCPICGMDLVPLPTLSHAEPRVLEVSADAAKLAEIETTAVARRAVAVAVELYGRGDFDETRIRTIAAWVRLRLDRLFVDYTGVPIHAGEHVAEVYSPELIEAQRALLETLRGVGRLKDSDSSAVRERELGSLEAVRSRLRLWGLSPDQITEIEKRGTASDQIVLNSPTSGIVIDKLATEGEWLETGSPIYKIGDVTRLWVILDAYESDLAWLSYGQKVEFATDAYPGEVFQGAITFIGWVVDETRTVKVRVNVDNADKRLKPGMLVRATVHSSMHEGGVMLPPTLAGTWISPMHPEIVKDAPGTCDVCGMDLVRAEELFAQREDAGELPLVIPVQAPLITGKRAVVYVKRPNTEMPTFEGRDVVLGPRAGEHYVVLSGLAEGEEVVVRGNFKIDSALQIEAQPSMMYPEGGGGAAHQHDTHGRGDRHEGSHGKDCNREKNMSSEGQVSHD